MFVSEYLGLDDELDKMGVFDCVLVHRSIINWTFWLTMYQQ